MTFHSSVVLQGVDDHETFIERVRRIESLGYRHLWMTDSSLHTRSPWSYLALAAAATNTLTLGTAVTNPLTRHTAIIAVEASTIAEISKGRFTLGIGAGDRPLLALGLDPARLRQLEDAIGHIRKLFTGDPISTNGGRDELVHARMHFPPPGPIPIYISASGPRTLELAGRIADGVIMLCGLDPVGISWALEQVDRGAEAAERPRPHVSVFAYGAVDSDRGQAMAAARPIAAWFPQTAPIYCDLLGLDPAIAARVREDYTGGEFQEAQGAAEAIPDDFVERIALCGDVTQTAQRLKVLASTGIDSVSVFPLGSKRGQTIELFSEAWKEAFA